jgi:hypothetical protein
LVLPLVARAVGTPSGEQPEREFEPDPVHAEVDQHHGQVDLHREAPNVPHDAHGKTSRGNIVSPFAGEYPDLAMDLVY